MINVLGENAAVKSGDAKPISRAFMISRAVKLRAHSSIEITDTNGKPPKVSAASWRAGFVRSARQTGIVHEIIRINALASVGGPIPYTVETLDVFQSMSKRLAISYSTSTRKGIGFAGAGGQFASCSLLL